MSDGGRLGNAPANTKGLRTSHLDIPARAGGSLGTLFAATEAGEPVPPDEAAALEAGVRLATLAIETRKLYKDLVYRSEFDLLTDIYNRFSLDRYLEQQIERAKAEESIFGLVYIDLDEFKQVNDFYGHHVGDLYLQEVSMRMKRQLRSGDMLARLGGDEFAALVPVVRSRAALEEMHNGWSAASMRPLRWKDMCFAAEQASASRFIPKTAQPRTACSAQPMRPCTSPSTPSGTRQRCRASCRTRSSSPAARSRQTKTRRFSMNRRVRISDP